MNATRVLDLVKMHRLMAVLRLDDLTPAEALTDALLNAGVRLLEFTLTHPDAVSVIRRLRAQVPAFEDGSAALGAGSVTRVEQAHACIDAGAQFLVTPVLVPEVIRHGVDKGIPVFPGAFTPTEIYTAWQTAARLVKIFPAGRLGPAYIKDVLAPLPEVRLTPTGGVNLNNLGEFLANGAMGVGVGNSLLDERALASGDWRALTEQAKRYVQAAATSP